MPKKGSRKPTTRLNLEIPQTLRDRIERLRDLSEAESMTEVIRRALATYEALLDHKQQHGQLRLIDDEGNVGTALLP